MTKTRCAWCDENSKLYTCYHDKHWSIPIVDGPKLFEMLILEGTQAGLSWSTILKKSAMNFVAPTIIYAFKQAAFLQAFDILNEHVTNYFRHQEVKTLRFIEATG